MVTIMEDLKENMKEENEAAQELDLEELEQVSGGSIGNARKEKTKPIDDSVANRF